MNISNYKRIIPAGQTVAERVTCTFIYCDYCSSQLRLRLPDGSTLNFKTGKKIRLPEQISFFFLENLSEQEIVVEYECGFGDVSDDSIKLQGSVSVFSGNNLSIKAVDLTAGSVSEILPYGSKRNSVVLQNNDAVDIWIGESDLDILQKNGYRIPVGGMLSLSVKSAIYAAASSAATISVIEILEG